MLGYIRGSLYFIYGLIVSYSSNKSIEENSNNKNEQTQSCNNIEKNSNFLGVIPYKAEDITHSMLNDPKNPHYIGHFFLSQERGAQYNL